jgi:DNA-binding LacI/PurR family transcriptional regulator
MVFLNRDVKGAHVASVWIDWRAATAEVVTYLADLGHRRVGLVVPSRHEIPYANREDWYRGALGRADLGPDPALIFHARITIEGGHEAGRRLLDRADRPTAVICHSDVMAIGLLQACGERGVRVPDDLSVVGWDDVPYASLVTPALTTVRVPRYELGQAAARRLLDLIAGRPAADPRPLALELVHRASCARPPVSPQSNPGVSTKRARGAASVSAKGDMP